MQGLRSKNVRSTVIREPHLGQWRGASPSAIFGFISADIDSSGEKRGRYFFHRPMGTLTGQCVYLVYVVLAPAFLKTMTSQKKKFAVFDIDGTIFRSSLLIELVEALIAKGIFPVSTRRLYAKEHQAWLDRRGGYDTYIWAVIRAFDRKIKGVGEHDFLRVVERVIKEHEHREYRYTRDLVRRLKRQGYFLLAISHSPKYIVDRFAKHLGFHKAYGFIFELDERGRFTGVREHLDLILNKAAVLRRAVEKEHLDLRRSIGVGDTESDISFLKLVQKPICFNPNRVLYREARRRGWTVVIERKDMIYELRGGKTMR